MFCRLQICCCLLLAVLFISVSFAFASPGFFSPQASSPEGTAIADLPAGCSITDYQYVDSEKCAGGKCYVPVVNCCQNGVLDLDIFDAVSGSLIHGQELCDNHIPGCRTDCTMCGDSYVQAEHGELCDKGNANGTAGSGCKSDCTLPVCGNGEIETENNEQCDGEQFKNVDANKHLKHCTNDCALKFCGDGELSPLEECDGSNFIPKPEGVTQAVWNTKFCEQESCTIKYPPTPPPGPCDGVKPPDTHGRKGCPRTGWARTEVVCARGTRDWSGGWSGAFRFVYSSQYGVKRSRGTDGRICWECVCKRSAGTGCFDPETDILVKDKGIVKAKDVAFGDELLNPLSGKSLKVKSVIAGPENELILVTYEFSGAVVNSKLSKEHVVKGKESFKRVSDLTTDDYILHQSGEYVKVKSIEKVDGHSVINFILETESENYEDHLIASDGLLTGDLWLQNNLEE